MPILVTYRLFIAHAWNYDDEYYRLIEYLDAAANFRYSNYSVPEHDPLATNNQLRENLREQIRPAQVILILSGIYVSHSTWIQFEIDFCNELEKPIIAVKPWGAINLPQIVQQTATEIVGWNTQSIIDAIRRNAR
ncbi:MAG TPA: TIR domain-containing protein [Chitinivibrionales bacterium]|nr:TIR domain-containing protein [Chitinivibrionales bacterium]